MKPTVGDIVHYYDGQSTHYMYAAIITAAQRCFDRCKCEETCEHEASYDVYLAVFMSDGIRFEPHAVEFDSQPDRGCWTWRHTPVKVRDGGNKPIPMVLVCPHCTSPHIDEGEWATKPHRTHLCASCGHLWRPAAVATVGVVTL